MINVLLFLTWLSLKKVFINFIITIYYFSHYCYLNFIIELLAVMSFCSVHLRFKKKVPVFVNIYKLNEN